MVPNGTCGWVEYVKDSISEYCDKGCLPAAAHTLIARRILSEDWVELIPDDSRANPCDDHGERKEGTVWATEHVETKTRLPDTPEHWVNGDGTRRKEAQKARGVQDGYLPT